MSFRIQRIAVLGSGIMGSRIACHMANAGFEVLLLDMAPTELLDTEAARGLQLDHPEVRNRLVQASLNAAVASKPSPLVDPGYLKRIRTGSFQTDLSRVKECDWILEAIVEDLAAKQSLYEQLEAHRRPGTLISTNTSGIPIRELAEGRSNDFQRHFCGTHFFNPPRYLHLMELIAGPQTEPLVLDALERMGDLFLGKAVVRCKDTPAFIANRIGVFSIMAIFRIMEDLQLSIEQVDALTGPVMGRPKSATFRTNDVVGLDTLARVARGLLDHCPEDEARDLFQLPPYVERMLDKRLLGDKTGSGFYKKVSGPQGSDILVLDLKTLEYVPKARKRLAALDLVKGEEDLGIRLKTLVQAQDETGAFYRSFFARLFSYVSHRIPDIADEPYRLDDAMKAGFGWEWGPFETWERLGFDLGLSWIRERSLPVAPWIGDMVAAGKKAFYQRTEGRLEGYDPTQQRFMELPGGKVFLTLDRYADKLVWQNASCRIVDIGDGVLALSWKTKMNTIGSEVIEGIHVAIQEAEARFAGLVIHNEGPLFSAGANLGLVFMLAAEQDWDGLHQAVSAFQQTSLRIRYSQVPVILSIHGLTLGGSCEFSLYADKVVAACETYMGLVETGVGIIPAGGGTTEMAVRASEQFREGEIELEVLKRRFMTVAMAKVSGSAHEAQNLELLRPGTDVLVMNPDRLLHQAKAKVLALCEAGYLPPLHPDGIQVLGREGLGALYTGIHAMGTAGYISEHDQKVGRKLAWVMCGGDLSGMTSVSESYLLDLEREAFVSLCGESKTLQRMEAVLKTGKPIRN